MKNLRHNLYGRRPSLRGASATKQSSQISAAYAAQNRYRASKLAHYFTGLLRPSGLAMTACGRKGLYIKDFHKTPGIIKAGLNYSIKNGILKPN